MYNGHGISKKSTDFEELQGNSKENNLGISFAGIACKKITSLPVRF